jgi:cytoskeletal protein RodZ
MSIGEQLKKARQERSLSLEQASYETHIRVHYLEALESGDFDALPSNAQARGFLRAYAAYLGIPSAPLLADLDGESHAQAANPDTDKISSSGNVQSEGTPAEAIFTEVGQRLKSQREVLGLSLDDIERHTHIRAHYLQALETGNISGLPSPVQGRGMLHNYADFLGLDPEPLLLRWADGLQAGLVARQTDNQSRAPRTRQRPTRGQSSLRRLFSTDVILGGIIVVFLVGFTAWGSVRSGGGTTPTAPSIAEVLLSSPTEEASVTETSTPEPGLDAEGSGDATDESIIPGEEATLLPPEIGTPTPTLPVFSGSQVQVYVVVHQRAWMRITVDDVVEFEGRVTPGSAYLYAGESQVDVLTGNGAGLQLFYNQRDLGPMGTFGQVVSRVFTLEGVEIPIATILPTDQPEPTDTPSP